MSTIKPFTINVPEAQLQDLKRPPRPHRACPSEVESPAGAAGPTDAYVRVADRPAAERLRLARPRSRDQPASAVHDRDRRPDHPLHPREVGREERHAAAAHPRLAGLDRRVPRRDRAADRSGRPWRQGRGCVRRRHPLAARLRLLGPDPRGGLEQRPDRRGLHRADGPPRLRALRRAGRRCRRDHRARDRPARAGPGDRRPSQRRDHGLHPDGPDRARGDRHLHRRREGPRCSGCSGSWPSTSASTPCSRRRPQALAYGISDSPVGSARLDQRTVHQLRRPARGRRRATRSSPTS